MYGILFEYQRSPELCNLALVDCSIQSVIPIGDLRGAGICLLLTRIEIHTVGNLIRAGGK